MAELGKDKLMDIAKVLSTPKELCKHCLEWCDGDFNDIPHCVDGHNGGVREYLFGHTDTCPCFFDY